MPCLWNKPLFTKRASPFYKTHNKAMIDLPAFKKLFIENGVDIEFYAPFPAQRIVGTPPPEDRRISRPQLLKLEKKAKLLGGDELRNFVTTHFAKYTEMSPDSRNKVWMYFQSQFSNWEEFYSFYATPKINEPADA
jgi:hypothetical protein